MKRTQVWAGLAMVLAVSLAGCGGAAAPQWPYAAAPSTAPPGTAVAGAAAGSASTPAPTAAPAAAPAAPAAASSMPGMGAQPAATTAPDTGAPDYVLFDPQAPALLPGTVHDVDLPIIEKDMTVAPGFVVHAWTFG